MSVTIVDGRSTPSGHWTRLCRTSAGAHFVQALCTSDAEYALLSDAHVVDTVYRMGGYPYMVARFLRRTPEGEEYSAITHIGFAA